MPSYVVLAVVGLVLTYAVHTYRCFAVNLAAAKQSGLPYFCKRSSVLPRPCAIHALIPCDLRRSDLSLQHGMAGHPPTMAALAREAAPPLDAVMATVRPVQIASASHAIDTALATFLPSKYGKRSTRASVSLAPTPSSRSLPAPTPSTSPILKPSARSPPAAMISPSPPGCTDRSTSSARMS